MKALAYALSAALILALAAVARAPATLVDARIAAETSNALRLADAQGTLWHGRGVLADAKGRFALPLAWTLDVLPLLRGVASIRLDPQRGAIGGDVAWREGAVRAERWTGSFPAALAALAARNGDATITLGGTVRIEAPRIELSRDRYDGTGTLRWTDATVSLGGSPPLALGEIVAAFAPTQAGLAGAVTNRGSPVTLKGEIVLEPVRTAVDLAIRPGPTADASTARLLAMLGPPDDGATRVRWQGPALLR